MVLKHQFTHICCKLYPVEPSFRFSSFECDLVQPQVQLLRSQIHPLLIFRSVLMTSQAPDVHLSQGFLRMTVLFQFCWISSGVYLARNWSRVLWVYIPFRSLPIRNFEQLQRRKFVSHLYRTLITFPLFWWIWFFYTAISINSIAMFTFSKKIRTEKIAKIPKTVHCAFLKNLIVPNPILKLSPLVDFSEGFLCCSESCNFLWFYSL